MDLFRLVVLALLLGLSAYFSAAETALFSLRLPQIHTLRQQDSRASRAILALLEHPRRLLATVLIGNTFAHVLMAVTGASAFVVWFGPERGPALATLCMGLVILVAGEILPKTLAVGAPLALARRLAASLRLAAQLLDPLAKSAVHLTAAVVRLLERRVPRRDEALSENEIKMLVTMGWEQGVVGVREKEFIHNVFHLNDRLVEDIVTPRTRVFAVDADAAVEDVRHAIAHAGYSRVPIFEGTRDNLVGYVEVSDLLWSNQAPDTRRLRSLRRELQFFPATLRVGELLLALRRTGEEIAAVVDEHGAFDGIVSLEDAAEQVVGEIIDLHDLERYRLTDLPDGDLLLSAQMEIDVFNALLGAELEDPDVDTLGGLVSKRLGRIPLQGEWVEIAGMRFTVEQAAPNRILRLRLGRRAAPGHSVPRPPHSDGRGGR